MLRRERFAWAWLVGLIVVPTGYFIAVAAAEPSGGGTPLARLGMLAAALTTLAVLALGVRFLPIVGGGEFAADERDQMIESRSSGVAYYVLMGGMIVVGFVMPFSASGWRLVHAALLAIVVAEISRYALILVSYRRGIRG